MCILSPPGLGAYNNVFDPDSIEEIESGFYGTVYKARKRIDDGLYYAIKKIPRDAFKDSEHLATASREPSMLAQNIQNPFAVGLIDSIWDDKYIYILMEYVDGIELFTYSCYLENQRKKRNFYEPDLRLLIAEMVCAIGVLHDVQKIIHRDIKLENFMLVFDGHVKLVDFGIARPFERLPTEKTYSFCGGTPDYRAPEIIRTECYGKAIDWWALGVCLYILFTDNFPFRNFEHYENIGKLYENILYMRFFRTYFHSLLIKRAKPLAVNLISRLLDKDPATRLGSGPNGTKDIKTHPFFSTCNWDAIENREYPVLPLYDIYAASLIAKLFKEGKIMGV